MIQVQGLSRRYGATLAIEDLDFQVEKGEVVGFLGLNGAGKTTTMRILAGSLGATAGSARIAGLEISTHPRQVQSRVGYLPELPPLYETMTVRSYVRFAGKLKGAAKLDAATDLALERTGTRDVGHRLIGHLSKGYRQRVGLAQALVHDPEVLLLDEPGSGLDPAQRQEIRQLILRLADESKTVLLSTHLLTDVEQICNRVVVIHEGRLVATDDMRSLQSLQVMVARPGPEVRSALEALPGTGEIRDLGEGRYALSMESDREAVARALVGFGLLEMGDSHRLEENFLLLTRGQKLADTPRDDSA